LVVLPFADLGDEPKRAFLADVVTDDLTIALSRIHGATVISTGTAFAFKGSQIDLKALGSELRVRYAVQGSVLRNFDRVRN
jgi:TolB-like protein